MHPIHFAVDSPDKIIAALRGRYFLYGHLSEQRPSICCRRLRYRLKAPLGLSLLRKRDYPEKTNNPNPSPIGNKFGLFLFGPSGENRTHGLLNPIQARYQNCATPGYRPPLPYRSVATRDIILRQGRFVNRFFDYFWFFLRKV